MSVLGMNQRNALIARINPRDAIRRANSKYEAKLALCGRDVPIVDTVAFLKSRLELAMIDLKTVLPDRFALKPNRGGQGRGILLFVGRDGDEWCDKSGRRYEVADIRAHARRILDAEFSLPGQHRDEVLIEALIDPAEDLTSIVEYGLPDVRVICLEDDVLMAMMRIPTRASGGRANLHRGAVGAAIDLRDGTIYRAKLGRNDIENHPDTGVRLIGFKVPQWQEVLFAARRCARPMGLGYVGVDVIVEARGGVKIIEVNAFPGLEIQNVCGAGLAGRLAWAIRERKRVNDERAAAGRERRTPKRSPQMALAGA